MDDVFGADYAQFYDATYSNKDYVQECDLVESLFDSHASARVRSVLDLGAGTGNHAIPLAQRGYQVTAVDRSKEMLDLGRAKPGSSQVSWIQADLRGLDLEATFDAALMLFAVLGYQSTNQDVRCALNVARSHLATGGLLICDVWYGPGVLAVGPSPRFKVIEVGESTYLRASTGDLDVMRHKCRVQIETWWLRGRRLEGHSREIHDMRFFFPLELDQFMSASGFELVRLGDFEDPEANPGLSSWNALVVARAV